ncbi:MAG TPA: Hsp20 family protein [Arsenophonus nasoniae]|uniref:Hsp20 family protein n=1 Tax=Arsenophonus nasoniae TaxID=638 RepID=UPI003879C6EF
MRRSRVACYVHVSVLNNQLTVRGKPNVEKTDEVEEKEGIKWLHQGIRKSEFSLSFTLEHRVVIQQANLANGLLKLHFTYDIPEQEKPQKIAIGVQNESVRVLEHNAA